MKIRNPKQRGEWAELRFMAKAAEFGFKLNKPFGESAPYDVVIDLGDRLARVQVKSTTSRVRPGHRHRAAQSFAVSLRRRCAPRYRLSDFEYLAVYVIPKDVWYVIPGTIVIPRHSIYVRPGHAANQYERYREAWHLLRERPHGAGRCAQTRGPSSPRGSGFAEFSLRSG